MDRVNISPGHPNQPASTAKTFANAGGDWVVLNTETLIADEYGSLAAGPYNAFAHTGTSGFDVTIDTGEAIIGGAGLARDATTSVTLTSSTNNQTVYVGWDTSQRDTVIIGLDSAFAADMPKTAIWEFDTDGSSITSATDLRPLGRQNAETKLSYSKSESDNRFVSKAGGTLSEGLDFGQHATINRLVEERTQRPTDPSTWQEWILTSVDPWRHEIQTPDGIYFYSNLAKVTPIVDDFADGDMAEYAVNDADHVVNTSQLPQLECTGFGESISLNGGGLDNYPSRGDTIEVDFYIPNGGLPSSSLWRFEWCVKSTSRDQLYRIEMDNDALTMEVRDGTNSSIGGSISHTFAETNGYTLVIDFQSTISVELYRSNTLIGSISGSNSTFDTGGIAFWTNDNVNVYWREVTLVQ